MFGHNLDHPAECPFEDPTLNLVVDLTPETYLIDQRLVDAAFAQGGSINQVVKAFEDAWGKMNFWIVQDLTGDQVPELFEISLYTSRIWGCRQGQIEVLGNFDMVLDGPQAPPELNFVVDMNGNDIPDLVLSYPATTGWFQVADIIEWNGATFISLMDAKISAEAAISSRAVSTIIWYDKSDWHYWRASANGPARVEVGDTNSDGFLELTLTDDGPIHLSTLYDLGPWRNREVIYAWNGSTFVPFRVTLGPPLYRFQALQDADRAFLMDEYENALTLYQDVIFSDQLDWWNTDKRWYLMNSAFGDPPDVEIHPTPSEYPSLAAYARFRIVLLHVVLRDEASAQIVFNTLQAENPPGSHGAPYAEMAALFWNEYLVSGSLELACAQVIAFARDNPDIMVPLGNGDHGFQSHEYVPEDLCPVW